MTELVSLPVRDLDVDFFIGVAWREPNLVHGDCVAEVVRQLKPAPGEPPFVV
ncbi:hypothetical protein [Agromyces sp. Soil535]|uniref:hypothetical protein n=1 Tax=Agromyces sp. Soil535 TaxID=1736390 RepID=UPI000B318AFC|nr:hypothetical protein [Agromyces sp. Soil535]